MIRRTVLIGLLAVASLGVTAAPVGANSGDVIARGHCSGASVWKLKLSREDGRLETEFEVDQNRNNRLWRVSIAQNGVTVYRARATRGHRRARSKSAASWSTVPDATASSRGPSTSARAKSAPGPRTRCRSVIGDPAR